MGHPSLWEERLDLLALFPDPIVHINTGDTYGLGFLIKPGAGFCSEADFLDQARRDGVLEDAERMIFRRASECFAASPCSGKSRLFLRIGCGAGDFSSCLPDTAMIQEGVHPSDIFLEIRLQSPFPGIESILQVIRHYKKEGCRILLNDFGSGFSDLKLLCLAEPDMVALDRYFTGGIMGRKRLVVRQLVSLVHLMGIQVLARGIETEQDYCLMRELGCDFIQGPFVRGHEEAPPQPHYGHISRAGERDRRSHSNDMKLILERMEYRKPLKPADRIIDILTMFRKNQECSFFPVVNEGGEPIGIIRERDLKSYVYNPYGISLLMNGSKHDFSHFLSKAPVADITSRVSRILEASTSFEEIEGVLITENGRYRGILTAQSILHLLNEKDIAEARDQNPLSLLPGNNRISEYVLDSLSDISVSRAFAYFDFDNFKPFNDMYGFRNGDRIILLFADLLKALSVNPAVSPVFCGHIGGDDFFAGFKGVDEEEVFRTVRSLIDKFEADVKSFYSKEDRARGYLEARSREGTEKRFPLMTVSAAVLIAGQGTNGMTAVNLSEIMARLKSEAKASDFHIAIGRL